MSMGNITHPKWVILPVKWVILPMRRRIERRYIVAIRGRKTNIKMRGQQPRNQERRKKVKKIFVSLMALMAVAAVAGSNGSGSDSVNWGGRINTNQADSV